VGAGLACVVATWRCWMLHGTCCVNQLDQHSPMQTYMFQARVDCSRRRCTASRRENGAHKNNMPFLSANLHVGCPKISWKSALSCGMPRPTKRTQVTIQHQCTQT
jgi:hypothetical protein